MSLRLNRSVVCLAMVAAPSVQVMSLALSGGNGDRTNVWSVAAVRDADAPLREVFRSAQRV